MVEIMAVFATASFFLMVAVACLSLTISLVYVAAGFVREYFKGE